MATCQKCGNAMGYGQIRCIACGHVEADGAAPQNSTPPPASASDHYAFGPVSSFCLMAVQVVSAVIVGLMPIFGIIALSRGLWANALIVTPLSMLLCLGNFFLVARVRAMKRPLGA